MDCTYKRSVGLYLISVSDVVCSLGLFIVDAYHAHYYVLLTLKKQKVKRQEIKEFRQEANSSLNNSLMKKIALRENRAANALPLNAGSVIYITASVRGHRDKGCLLYTSPSPRDS